MTSQEREILSEALVEVCTELLAAPGRVLERQPAASPAPEAKTGDGAVVASVGLSGRDVKGALVLMGDVDFLRSIYPAELSGATIAENDLADWAGEVANQLLGRLKNRFCRRGLDFSISTPTVIRGVRLQISGAEPGSGIHHRLVLDQRPVDVYFQVARQDDQPLLQDEESTSTASAEGETLLF
jgi:CheY-specific phosphatase CheX